MCLRKLWPYNGLGAVNPKGFDRCSLSVHLGRNAAGIAPSNNDFMFTRARGMLRDFFKPQKFCSSLNGSLVRSVVVLRGLSHARKANLSLL